MQEVVLAECRRLFRPHPNLSDEVNRNILQSEIEGGVFLGDLPPSTVLQIHTQHHCYTMLLLGDDDALSARQHGLGWEAPSITTRGARLPFSPIGQWTASQA